MKKRWTPRRRLRWRWRKLKRMTRPVKRVPATRSSKPPGSPCTPYARRLDSVRIKFASIYFFSMNDSPCYMYVWNVRASFTKAIAVKKSEKK